MNTVGQPPYVVWKYTDPVAPVSYSHMFDTRAYWYSQDASSHHLFHGTIYQEICNNKFLYTPSNFGNKAS
jgi:hypothetical protein